MIDEGSVWGYSNLLGYPNYILNQAKASRLTHNSLVESSSRVWSREKTARVSACTGTGFSHNQRR